jgi:transposase
VSGPIWLDQLDLPRAYTTRIESIRDLVEVYDREIDMLEREIHRQLTDHAGYKAIQAIPGVGRTIAAIMVAEIGDIAGFPNPQALCSWAGLTPKHHESDTKVRRGRITKQGSKLVRWAAIEAVSNGRGGPKLKADYHRIAERRPKNVARWRWPASFSSWSSTVRTQSLCLKRCWSEMAVGVASISVRSTGSGVLVGLRCARLSSGDGRTVEP